MVKVYVAVFLLEFSAVLKTVITRREEFKYKGVILKGKTNKQKLPRKLKVYIRNSKKMSMLI